MKLDSWRHLDPRDLRSWPLGAQCAALCVLLAAILALAYLVVLQEPLTGWRLAQQQRHELEVRLSALQAGARAMDKIAPLLPKSGLGCSEKSWRDLAAELGITALIGNAGEDKRQGGWTEARANLFINASYNDLQRFSTELAHADYAVVIAGLNLAPGPSHLVEMQAQIHCIRQASPQVTP